MSEALGLRGISKRFGAVEALSEVDFSLERGEIHALLGENGAGKSTLMKVAFGLARSDAGTVAIDEVVTAIRNPSVARARGLGMVHQHFTSIPAFTVIENIALAAGWAPRAPLVRPRLQALMQRTGFTLDPETTVADLSAGLKQRLEVLQALATDAGILLLDEPSSVLPPEEAEAFLDRLQGLRLQGVSAVLITHKLEEALRVADRVTILRRGRVVHSSPTSDTTVTRLATAMLGEPPPTLSKRRPPAMGEVRVRVSALSLPRVGATGTGLRSATLLARAGEIVGLAAIEGNGQRELFRVLAGLATPTAGTMTVAEPISFVPEDRTREGLIPTFTLTENLVLARGPGAPWVRGPWIDWPLARERMSQLVEAFDVRTRGIDTEIGRLSGGNQQRMVIAAALERAPAVILAENPTRGLDIRAATDIHRRLREAADSGSAVLVHLPDLDELLAIADRIVVLSAGQTTELAPTASREEIGHHLLAQS